MINRLLVTIIFAVLFLHANTNVKAQGYRQLNISDFRASPDLNRKFAAYIFWEVNYKYRFEYPSKKMEFDVQLYFLHDKSWFITDRLNDKQITKLLNHEQMHFAIGEMMNRAVKKTLSDFKYSENFKVEVDSLFKLTNIKYVELGDQYDRETKHGTDTVSQMRWDAYIKTNLDAH